MWSFTTGGTSRNILKNTPYLWPKWPKSILLTVAEDPPIGVTHSFIDHIRKYSRGFYFTVCLFLCLSFMFLTSEALQVYLFLKSILLSYPSPTRYYFGNASRIVPRNQGEWRRIRRWRQVLAEFLRHWEDIACVLWHEDGRWVILIKWLSKIDWCLFWAICN